MVKTPKLRLRLLAAAWAAAVAGLLWTAYLIIVAFRQEGIDPSFTLFATGAGLVTAAAAGISGFAIGWRLFAPDKWHDAEAAIACGISIAALAYLILCAILGVAFYVWSLIKSIQGDVHWGPTTIHDFGLVVFVGPLVGIWYTGWIILPVAAAVGYFLSRHYRK